MARTAVLGRSRKGALALGVAGPNEGARPLSKPMPRAAASWLEWRMFKGFWLALGLVYGTVAAAQTFTFPIDENAVARNRGGLFVSDAVLYAAIPGLDKALRLRTCIGPMSGGSATIEFAPTVTGTHTGIANRLSCSLTPTQQFIAATSGQLTCSEAAQDQRAVVFDRAPAEYFWLGSGIAVDEALTVFRAFRDETIEYENIEPRLRPKGRRLSQMTSDGSDLLVRFAECGCSWSIRVEHHAARLVASKLLSAKCR